MQKLPRILFLSPVLTGCFTLLAASGVAAADQADAQIRDNIDSLIKHNACVACDLRGADLTRLDLSGADLRDADLSGASLFLVDLSDGDLRGANLRGARLGGADLANADLRGADLRGAVLAGAYTAGAKMDGSLEDRETVNEQGEAVSTEQVYVPDDKKPKKMEGQQRVEIPEAREPQADPPVLKEHIGASDQTGSESLSPPSSPEAPPEKQVTTPAPVAVVQETAEGREQGEPVKQQEAIDSAAERPASAIEQQIETGPAGAVAIAEPKEPPAVIENQGAGSPDRKGAELAAPETTENATKGSDDMAMTVAKLLDTKKCYGCNLAGANLKGKNLRGADLESSQLSGADLQETNLRSANLKNVSLRNANLRKADLGTADLYKADLSGADLTGASLKGARIDEANFDGAIGYQPEL